MRHWELLVFYQSTKHGLITRKKTNEFRPYKAVSQSQRRTQIINGDVNKIENHFFLKEAIFDYKYFKV